MADKDDLTKKDEKDEDRIYKEQLVDEMKKKLADKINKKDDDIIKVLRNYIQDEEKPDKKENED